MTSVPHSGAKSVTPGGSVAGGAVKERPILFSAPMVRALLDGRKTQTRRVVKPRRDASLFAVEADGSPVWSDGYIMDPGNADWRMRDNPYGAIGDHLWVKETWRPATSLHTWDLDVTYRADGALRTIKDGEFGDRDWTMPKAAATGNVSPLFMPRWASRLVLEITDVRVERLLDCSDADARAEGLQWVTPGMWSVDRTLPIIGDDPRRVYFELWDHINGAGAAEVNPWVWAVSFRVLDQEAIAKATAGETRNAEGAL